MRSNDGPFRSGYRSPDAAREQNRACRRNFHTPQDVINVYLYYIGTYIAYIGIYMVYIGTDIICIGTDIY